MKKNRPSLDAGLTSLSEDSPSVSLVKAEKGSRRSMWELLLQLRALLPYLSHLAPLLERTSKVAPDLGELSRGVAVIQSGSRELETLSRNQALQIERMEAQILKLQTGLQVSSEESRAFFTEMRAFRLWMIRITLVIALLVGATAGMVAYLLSRAP